MKLKFGYSSCSRNQFSLNLLGHGKFETLGALGISGVLLATGGGIAWHAIDVLVVIFLISVHSPPKSQDLINTLFELNIECFQISIISAYTNSFILGAIMMF